jgi:hypothetical protein
MTDINISAAQVTNLYLYRQSTTPNNLTDPSVVSQQGPQTPMTFDIEQYMTDGAGRFGKPSQFSTIRWFMENAPVEPTGVESRTSLAELAAATGRPLIERVT